MCGSGRATSPHRSSREHAATTSRHGGPLTLWRARRLAPRSRRPAKGRRPSVQGPWGGEGRRVADTSPPR
eukprot:scaffold6908_cov175-Prasinococcus_capsulatus_cf.AAC.1